MDTVTTQELTPAQHRLALADTAFVLTWLLMNFFWMREMYHVSIPIAVPAALATAVMLWWTERTFSELCLTGSNVCWLLKDFFWMMENSGGMPSGVLWGTVFFVLTMLCTVAALIGGAYARRWHSIATDVRRVRGTLLGAWESLRALLRKK